MKIDGMPAQKCEDVTKELIKLQGMKDAKVTKTQEVQYEGGGGSRGESVHRGWNLSCRLKGHKDTFLCTY